MTNPSTIKLELTPEQYRHLILAAYLGAAMVNTARDEMVSEAEDGGAVQLPPELDQAADAVNAVVQRLLAGAETAEDAGLEEHVERGEDGELYPGAEIENLAVDCADLYGESIFWTHLAQSLAERDLGQLRAQNRPLPEGLDEAELLQSLMEMYLEEFTDNGLDNMMIPMLDENEMNHPN